LTNVGELAAQPRPALCQEDYPILWLLSLYNFNIIIRQHLSGLMRRRIASINDLPIKEADRKHRWPRGRRPDKHPNLSDLGL
jgi:uncharacterized protein